MKVLSLNKKFLLIAVSSFCFIPIAFGQENTELAVVNEVIINSSPLHENIAEKYLEAATGDRRVAISEVSNSATKLSVPLEKTIAKGSFVHDDKVKSACASFHRYIRKLRTDNADGRKSSERPKLIYNLQCSPNSVLSISALPNDTRLAELWAVDQTNNVDLDLRQAWDKHTGRGDVVVAIIDTGLDYTHPDIAANAWKNEAELNGVAGIDDDGNGVIDDIYGYNAISGANNPGDPIDDNNHGTHCGGTIGGVGNNGQGVVGVNWNVKLMATKFLSASGSGQTYDAIKALDYITNKKLSGVNIVATNNSWGGGGYSSGLRDAIARSNSAGILFIAAAGNSGQNIDAYPSYPASYDVDNIISVGAIDANGAMAYFSNYGTSSVDIVAPGVSILSSIKAGGYAYFNGTSMATPHVTGVIALLKSYAPAMNLTQLKNALYNTGKSVSGAIGTTKYGVMPSMNQMLLEADRLGLGGVVPSPTATSTPRPTNTPLPTATPTVTPTPLPTVAPGYFSIRGVAKVGSSLLARAKVVLQYNGQTVVGYTDSNGAFNFLNVYGPVNYSLTVVAAGQTFTAYSSSLVSNVNMVLSGTTKNYILKAKVLNELGQAVSGAEISDPILGTVVTASDGIAQFNVPYGTSYLLNARKGTSDFLVSGLNGQIYGDITRVFIQLPD